MNFVTSLAGFLCLGVAAWRRMRITTAIGLPTSAPTTVTIGRSRRRTRLPISLPLRTLSAPWTSSAEGLRRVGSGGDLQIAYRAAVNHKKEFNGVGSGPRWRGLRQVNTSTIEMGKLIVELFDPARNQLVWRGDAEKTLDIKKNPDKNSRNLHKAVAKLFKNYPPGHAQE